MPKATSVGTIEYCDKRNQRVRPSINVSEKQAVTHKLIHEGLLKCFPMKYKGLEM